MARSTLQEQIDAGVRAALAAMGFAVPGERAPVERTDYIAFGSPEHQRFLGLVVVNEGDDTAGYTLHRSQESGVTYRLEDEIGVVSMYPSIDPEKAALLVLRQKVNEFEAGPPQLPENAPSLWEPVDKYAVPVRV